MDTPPAETAIRFIAVFRPDLGLPARHLVLGHAAKHQNTHIALRALYGLDRESKNLYAGYLSVTDGKLKVIQGGCRNIKISGSDILDEKMERDLNINGVANPAILELFPLLTTGKVQHTLIAQW